MEISAERITAHDHTSFIFRSFPADTASDGPRLLDCSEAVLAVEGKTAHAIFGSPDDMKLASCATLFAEVSPPGSVFGRILEKYYGGARDDTTITLLVKLR